MIPAHAIFYRKAGAILWRILSVLMMSWVGWGHLQAGVPFQLLDINKQSAGSSPSNFVPLGDFVLFSAEEARFGRELWRTDGTVEGTRLVKDIYPGPIGAFSSGLDFFGFVAGGNCYFSAYDGTHGLELWRSDGTAEGTTLVANIASGRLDSYPFMLSEFQGEVYFLAHAQDGPNQNWWKTDGSSEGTVRLQEWPDESGFLTGTPMEMNDELYFSLSYPPQLWKTDGMSGFLELILDGAADFGLSSVNLIAVVGDKLFLAATDTSHGTELWISDGTAGGTELLMDIWDGASSSNPKELLLLPDRLVFSATDPVRGRELWVSDGTVLGTMPLANIRSGAASSNPRDALLFDGEAYFLATGESGRNELWKSDGTPGGTQFVFGPSNLSLVQLYASAADRLYFSASDAVHGREIWSTDGTALGTYLSRDIRAGDQSGVQLLFFQRHQTFDSVLYFQADDGLAGPELWRSDGTEEGTFLLSDIFSSTDSSNPHNFESVNGTTLFWADDGTHGSELWATDGTVSGTQMLLDTWPGSFSGDRYNNYIRMNGARGFFVGRDLWKTDGTENGTALVTTVGQGSNDFMWAILEIGGEHGLFHVFPANAPEEWQLWRTDGTADGTEMIYSFTRYPDQLFGSLIMWIGGIGYFVADDGIHGRELWRTNGTTEGTMLVKDIYPGTQSSQIFNIWELNGWAVFSADDGVHGGELWRSDGTEEGTVLVKDMTPGTDSAFPDSFGQPSPQGRMLLSVYGANGGLFDDVTLWITDGTESGTQPITVPDIGYFRGVLSSILLDDGWMFSADDGIHGWESWKTDGSSVGTQLFKDFVPGPESSTPIWMADYGESVLINVNDTPEGSRLWKSNGTALGTEVFYPASVGLPSAGLDPFNSHVTGDRLFFSGVSDEGGRELWVMPLDDTLDAHQSWLLKWFNDSSGAGPTAPNEDLNANGVPILIEYALDFGPLGAGDFGNSLPQPVVDSASDCLSLSFQRFLDRTDVTLTVQAGDSPGGPWTDLATSSNGESFVALQSGVHIEESGVSVRRHVKVCDVVSASMSPTGRRFMRLRVAR